MDDRKPEGDGPNATPVKDENADSRIKIEGRRVWLDDCRKPPFGWEWAKTHDAAVCLLEGGDVAEISLDHDLADVHYQMESSSGYSQGDPYAGAEKTGYHVCLWMAENNRFPPVIRIHSASNVGRARMRGVIERYAPEGTVLIMMGPGQRPE